MHLWQWFWHLRRRCKLGFEGNEPLTYHDIGWWLLVTKTLVLPEEIQILFEMDDIYRGKISELAKERRERERQDRKGNQSRRKPPSSRRR